MLRAALQHPHQLQLGVGVDVRVWGPVPALFRHLRPGPRPRSVPCAQVRVGFQFQKPATAHTLHLAATAAHRKELAAGVYCDGAHAAPVQAVQVGLGLHTQPGFSGFFVCFRF